MNRMRTHERYGKLTNTKVGELFMDGDREVKLARLLEQHRRKNKNDYSVLFNECITSLGAGTMIVSQEKSDLIYKELQEHFEFTFYGRINPEGHIFEELILSNLDRSIAKDEMCYILWSHGNDPVIQVNIYQVIKKIDDVLAVSPDVWLYKINEYVIEIFHNGVIRKIYKNKSESR